MKPTVVIIEDNSIFYEYYQALLEEQGYEVVCLTTFISAFSFLKILFSSLIGHAHVKAIMFDYILDNHNQEVNSVQLISRARHSGFQGIMLAHAHEDLFRSFQIKAGCTHQLEDGFDKCKAAEYLLKLLRENQ